MYRNILVAVDGSDLATRALEHALTLSKSLGSKVTLVTVVEPTAVAGGGYPMLAGVGFEAITELVEGQRSVARALLDEAVAFAAAQGAEVGHELVENSFAAEGIIATAERVGADLIVMGSHGLRGLSRVLLGSQTSNVLAHTKLPVLVTR